MKKIGEKIISIIIGLLFLSVAVAYVEPTNYPSPSPTYYPSPSPTYYPSPSPTYYPSPSPTYYPSPSPTYYPSYSPTPSPTYYPTYSPTPSSSPTQTPSVANCMMLTEDLILQEDKIVAGTCFIIGADNIMIDGNGYTITGDNTGIGVYNPNGYDNIKVKNLKILNFKNGIQFKQSANSEVTGITIETSAVGANGILFDASPDALITSNTITTKNAQTGAAILVLGSTTNGFPDRSIISDNIIEANGPYGYGIDIRSCTECKVQNNEVLTKGQYGLGILFISVKDGDISNNRVTLTGTDTAGIKLNVGVLRTNVYDNEVTLKGQRNYGIALEGAGYNVQEVQDNTIEANTILGETVSSGILVKYSSKNLVRDNDINLKGKSRSSGILVADAHENNFDDNRITSPDDFDLYMSGVGGGFESGEGNIYTNTYLGDTRFETSKMAYVNINHEDEKKTIFPIVMSDFNGTNVGGYMLISSYNNNPGYADIKYYYSEDETLNESTIRLYRYIDSRKRWILLEDAIIDIEENSISPGFIQFQSQGDAWIHMAAFGQNNSEFEVGTQPMNDSDVIEEIEDLVDVNETEDTTQDDVVEINITETEDNEDYEEEESFNHACADNKILVCHVISEEKKEICISVSALEAHLSHGDNEGICQTPQVEEHLLPVVPANKKTEIMTQGTVKNINFKLKEEKKQVKINVESRSTPPQDVQRQQQRRVYNYVVIDHPEISNSEITESTLQFKVERRWVDSIASSRNVVLSKYEDEWRDLKTRYLSKDSEYYYYESETEGFSVFAINIDSSADSVASSQSSSISDLIKKVSNPESAEDKYSNLYLTIFLLSVFALLVIYLRPKKKNARQKNDRI